MSRIQRQLFISSLFLLTTFSPAGAREWTDEQGRTIEADYLSSNDEEVIFNHQGKEISYAIAKLSEADQKFIAEKQAEAAANAPPTGWLGDHPITHPAFDTTEGYLESDNAEIVYESFDRDDPPHGKTNTGDAEADFQYKREDARMIVYVPPEMAPEDAKGVYLHISPGSGGENRKEYRPVMDRLGLIYASPKDSSNDEPMLKRVKLAVDALATVKATWNIDESRVVVGGLSGGGHMAMLTHAMFPEMFRASVSHAAQSYLPGPGGGGHFAELTPSDLDSGELREDKWCVISGDEDYNYEDILKSSEEWEEQGFDYRFFDVPGMGHVNATPEDLEKALRWIGLGE